MFDFYAPSVRSDELYHWKYKRKYKGPSGKWVYVYDDGTMSEGGTTTFTRSETDLEGNTYTERKEVVTNPNIIFTRKEKYSNTVTDASRSDNGGPKQKTHEEVTTERIEYGRFHVARMNLERKISEIPSNLGKKIKKAWTTPDPYYYKGGGSDGGSKQADEMNRRNNRRRR